MMLLFAKALPCYSVCFRPIIVFDTTSVKCDIRHRRVGFSRRLKPCPRKATARSEKQPGLYAQFISTPVIKSNKAFWWDE